MKKILLLILLFSLNIYVFANENTISRKTVEHKIRAFVQDLISDVYLKKTEKIIDKHYQGGIFSSEYGNMSKAEMAKAFRKGNVPITKFIYGVPNKKYLRQCQKYPGKILYTSPTHFFMLYGNDFFLDIKDSGIIAVANNLQGYSVGVKGREVKVSGMLCSFQLPTLHLVVDNDRLFLISILFNGEVRHMN